MTYFVKFSADGTPIIKPDTETVTRRNQKGKSLLQFPKSFTVIDTETTGLDFQFDKIIEIAALKIQNEKIISKFSSLINPGFEISEFIENLTGIKNEDLKKSPNEKDVLSQFLSFVEGDIIVAHNANFDVNFIYDAAYRNGFPDFSNDFVDTLRLSREIRPDLEHHRLKDLADEYKIVPEAFHRALADCETTLEIFKKLLSDALNQKIDLGNFEKKQKERNHSKDFIAKNIVAEEGKEKPWNPLYNKQCVFTGKLEAMTRKEAAQLVVNLGGICTDGVTKKTNFLVMGSNEYHPNVENGKSSKQKKAESLILKGADLQILSESSFLEMLSE